jgi:hypothetical protein
VERLAEDGDDMMGMGSAVSTAGRPRGDDLEELRESLRRGQTWFDGPLVARLLDRLADAERNVRLLTRPEAVDFRAIGGETYVVLRCRACRNEFTGPTQASFLAAPPAPCE